MIRMNFYFIHILGIGYSLRTKLAFNFLKSDTIRTVPFFFGIMNVGLIHALHDVFPQGYHTLYFLYRVCLYIWSTGKGLRCTGSAPGLSSYLIGETLKSPKLPLNDF